ncbi:MAG: hypothetical protein JO300_07720 [Silvibacterium sp.]|nr:hypothetical protein [Silvibacterium sp.]MBV8552259.1 hypothetical protein [Acidobacteriaceae bacterium]
MPKILEVIVTSEAEAVEAEAGGADRLELVRALDVGGLTPDPVIVERILAAVTIPVRVMVRDEPSFSPGGADGLHKLQQRAAEFIRMGVDGLVLGFAGNSELDLETTRAVLSAAPTCRATFHRAFDEVVDPLLAIEQLKTIPEIDRILTSGGNGTWQERRARLLALQAAAGPAINILVGAGICEDGLAGLGKEQGLYEIHIGRAARVPQTVDGHVDRHQVAALKSALA